MLQEQRYTGANRHAYNIGTGSLNGTDKKSAFALNTVRSGFIHGIACVDVGLEDRVGKGVEGDLCCSCQLFSAVFLLTDKGQAGNHLVRFPLQAA